MLPRRLEDDCSFVRLPLPSFPDASPVPRPGHDATCECFFSTEPVTRVVVTPHFACKTTQPFPEFVFVLEPSFSFLARRRGFDSPRVVYDAKLGIISTTASFLTFVHISIRGVLTICYHRVAATTTGIGPVTLEAWSRRDTIASRRRHVPVRRMSGLTCVRACV